MARYFYASNKDQTTDILLSLTSLGLTAATATYYFGTKALREQFSLDNVPVFINEILAGDIQQVLPPLPQNVVDSLESLIKNITDQLGNIHLPTPSPSPTPTPTDDDNTGNNNNSNIDGSSNNLSVVGAVGDFTISANAQKTAQLLDDEGCQGLIALGDYTYTTGASNVTKFCNMFSATIKKAMRLAKGNHEASGDLSAYLQCAGQSSWNFAYQLNQYAAVVVLDTESNPSQSEVTQLLDSIKDYKWKIVAFHKPAVTSDGNHHKSSENGMRSWLIPLMQQKGVKLVLQAHNHNYERFLINGIVYIVVGTGGRSFYPISSTGGSLKAITNVHGICKLAISSSSINLSFVSHDRQVLDSAVIT